MSQKLKTLKYVLGRAGWGGMTHTLENTKKKKIHIKKIICEYTKKYVLRTSRTDWAPRKVKINKKILKSFYTWKKRKYVTNLKENVLGLAREQVGAAWKVVVPFVERNRIRKKDI